MHSKITYAFTTLPKKLNLTGQDRPPPCSKTAYAWQSGRTNCPAGFCTRGHEQSKTVSFGEMIYYKQRSRLRETRFGLHVKKSSVVGSHGWKTILESPRNPCSRVLSRVWPPTIYPCPCTPADVHEEKNENSFARLIHCHLATPRLSSIRG